MTEHPRFSVTVPAFNAEATLAQTLDSVRSQTFSDWELVIVDDGSTDSTLSLAQSYAAEDDRIRVVTQENRGSGGAYNTAVRAARAELLVMLSADDLLLPNHLAEFDAFIQAHPSDSIFSSSGLYEYDDGTRESEVLHLAWRDQTTCTLVDMLRACFFDMGAVYRHDVFDAVGGFNEDVYAEDYLFFLSAMAKGFSHRYLDQPLAVHRRNSLQKSADGLRVRQAELFAIRQTVAAGLLGPSERAAARRAIQRIRVNILIRKTLTKLLGPEGSIRLIMLLRRWRQH